jgi:hypothetical protein
VGVLVVLLLAVSAAAVIAVDQRNAAQAQALTSTSELLAAQARSIADSRPDLARQLLVQGYRLARTQSATGAVLAGGLIPRVIAIDDGVRGSLQSPARSARGGDEQGGRAKGSECPLS